MLLTPSALLLIPLGFVVAAVGTLVGVGGGFVLVPVLLVLLPNYPPALITSVSLVVVSVNAFSGALAYLRMRRVDVYMAAWFAAATVPGAVLGAYLIRLFERESFERAFGVLLLIVAILLGRRPTGGESSSGLWRVRRELLDRQGALYIYSVPMVKGLAVSVAVGCLSSLFGVGGGIIHVPAMILLLSVPVLIATATSQLVLAITASIGSLTHAALGHLSGGAEIAMWLAIGAVPGSQVGVMLSRHLHTKWIVRVLAVVLAAAAIQFIV